MPDARKHRGPHPEDRQLFANDQVPVLCRAVADLSWLLTHGYAPRSSLKLVGDRYALLARQRTAVSRCACGDDDQRIRAEKQAEPEDLKNRELWIDGYNVLTSIEAALSGGVILKARDGCVRDMASMHGSYRRVHETLPAMTLLGKVMADMEVPSCHWLLDKPVSNSGRLKGMLCEAAAQHGWPWDVELVPDPDALLIQSNGTVASADSIVITRSHSWFNLARTTIEDHIPGAWIVDLATSPAPRTGQRLT